MDNFAEMSAAREEAVRFEAAGGNLFGILHLPEGAGDISACLLMVVGGPQTRVGSHRSYTLIARELCRRGVPVLRFDYAGIGDSEGRFIGFADAGPSLEAAVAWLFARFPSLEKAILWSLCDGAAACALFAPGIGPRVPAMILCNPYVHSQQGQAKTYLKHYYLRRILEGGFWRKLLSFQVNPLTVLSSFSSLLKRASDPGAKAPGPAPAALSGSAPPPGLIGPGEDPPQLPEKVMDGLKSFRGRLVLLLSSDDFTAKEFLDLYRARERQPGKAIGAELKQVEGADHTFSTREWKLKVCDLTWEAWQALR